MVTPPGLGGMLRAEEDMKRELLEVVLKPACVSASLDDRDRICRRRVREAEVVDFIY